MRALLLFLSITIAPIVSADWVVLGIAPDLGTVGGGDLIKIHTTYVAPGDCNPFPCDYFPTVMFGDVEARSAININGTVDVITPAHARGTVPVTIDFGGQVRTIGTFRFMDAQDGLPHPNYEFLLLPVFVGGTPSPGANGSLWTSELWVTNRGQHRVELMHPLSVCRENCAAGPFPAVEAGETKEIEVPDDDVNAAHLLYAQFGGLDDLAFSLRIRDVSHAEEHHGTEIPIVRRSEFKENVTILNVPVDNTARTALRIYSLLVHEADIRVNIHSMSGPEILRSKLVRLRNPADGTPAAAGYFSYAFVPDLQNELPPGRYRIELTSTDPVFIHLLYALVSVTNNRTQLVTAIPSH